MGVVLLDVVQLSTPRRPRDASSGHPGSRAHGLDTRQRLYDEIVRRCKEEYEGSWVLSWLEDQFQVKDEPLTIVD